VLYKSVIIISIIIIAPSRQIFPLWL